MNQRMYYHPKILLEFLNNKKKQYQNIGAKIQEMNLQNKMYGNKPEKLWIMLKMAYFKVQQGILKYYVKLMSNILTSIKCTLKT